MDSAEAALDRLCDPAFEVSAHYFIAEDGRVFRMVAEDQRAWHAGAGQWGCVSDINSRSIGIELANRGDHPFAAAQMEALEGLLAGIVDRHTIPKERIIGHSDMAPTRKIDPGARFDWARLAKRGIAANVQAQAPIEVVEAAFVFDLCKFGYPETPLNSLLSAFRARFRPRYDGPLDGIDCAMAQNLASRFPVDREDPSA